MRKILSLLLLLALGVSGAWADVTVTVHDQSTQAYTSYGSLSTTTITNDTYTTNAASGLEGLKLTNSALAWNRAGSNPYYLLQGVYSSGDVTTNVTTITAPEGYLITGYSMEACGWNNNRTFTATAADGTTSITVNSSTTQTLSVSNLKTKSTTISVVGAATETTTNNWFSIKNFTVTLAKIDFVSLTFDKPGSATNNITVNVKDADGDAIPGVTASLESTSCTEFKTGSATALSRTTNSVLAPQAGYGNAQGSTITYTFKVEGLPTTFVYNKAALDVYALTGGGAAQGNDGSTAREWTFDVETGASTDALASFVSQSGNDICTVEETDGDLYHKLWTMTGTDKAATDALYVKVTLTKTASLGCFAGIGEVQLYKPGATVQYVISDGSGVVFTSDAVNTTEGDVITELPSAYQRSYCTYSAINQTMVAGDNTVNVTVTYDLPFTVSTDFANATWYYATIRGTKYLRADESAKDGSGRYSTNSSNERTDAYKWAFYGNPYSYFYIANKGQAEGKFLNAGSIPTFETVATPATTDATLWEATSNGAGFTLRSITGATLYINDAGGTGNLGYWNNSAGQNDEGGRWAIEEVSVSDKAALAAAIAAAQELVDNAGIPGYINAATATTLSSAITTAQSVYNDAAGDYVSAYNTLAAAIETAAVPANINYTPRTDVYYTIVNSRGAMVYDPSHSSSVDTQNDNAEYIWYGSTTPDATDANNLWGFIESEGNYYMYNVGKKQFATVGHGTYGSTWIFSDTPAYITLDDGIADEIVPPGVRVRATIATTGSSYTMSVSTSYTGPVITYDGNGDGGVPMTFAESSVAVDNDITDEMTAKVEDLTPYRNALKAVIDACDDYSFGSGLNQYASTNEYTTALAAANTAYANGAATKSDLQTAQSNLETAIAGLSINLPATGKFYRIKGCSGNYITSNTAGSNASMNGTASANNIVYYSSNSELIFFGSGLGLYNTSIVAPVSETKNAYTFSKGAQTGHYYIRSNTSSYGTYCYDNTSNGTKLDRNGSPVTSDSYQTDWTLEEVTELLVTITAAKVGTLYSPVALTIPAGVKAYVGQLDGSTINLTQVSGTIPAETGVYLEAEAGTYNFVITADVTEIESCFTGTIPSITNPATETSTVYALGNGSKGYAFYKWTMNLNGFKAFLTVDTASPSNEYTFKFVDDDITGIEGLENSSAQEAKTYFDLQGRKVTTPQKGQVYIVNGKKVLF